MKYVISILVFLFLGSTQKNMSIIQAVNKGDLKVAETLLSSKNVNSTNEKKQNLLLLATYNNDYKMAELLIKHGANPNQQDDILNSAFLYAGASGYLELAKLFLKNGARFDVFNRYNGTALIPAAERGHTEMVKLLSNTPNFPVNHVNRLGWTALMEAVVLGDGSKKFVEIVQILLSANADKTIPDKDGVTALQHAKQRGFEEMVRVLE